jgi:dsRNA-specific ribonuclease
MAQIFVEGIFEKHVNWTDLVNNDDNYKNILQVKIQKEFKKTPTYMEISEQTDEEGYHMGVYLCLNCETHEVNHKDSLPYENFNSFESIHKYLEEHTKLFIFFAESKHKIKKKAEQAACQIAINKIN